ncbi:PrsW family intramembrane metalloprotease [Geodermatophilus sabuli]|uniref:Membrane proteinase PrsW, cleaves anti-sigma factor RsiW, M82 family n=1 Tax=Geodermatophilus sabuli TaxID=1564158 RepID=A0A285EK42_9ACTN|nr:PrsW family intramembrane metalloprotease [Geodermatophilus sabuli]MBB3086030.1 RsiW-degrading membrane proteinase PrsW (M82 family) [Geodermatophilus sabuli]SNX98371.1 Membrane proteinase PrsW, cleaves anti-sigma factor RsiW, M82 family [Geodermatophilus sabuli]
MSTGTAHPVTESGAEDPARRQAEALEISGWGQRFTFVQPHNPCFWVFVVLTGIGVFQTWSYFAPDVGFYAEGFAIAAVLCSLCGLAWWAWFRHIDRWERQPGGLILAALVWGAVPATFAFALTANTALLGIYPKLFGQDWTSDWAAGATAPFTEEAAKLCGFVLLMGLAPKLVRTANDGLILGAFIGLGFAVFEDFLYSANAAFGDFGTDAVGNAVQMSVTRIATSAVSHPLFSALVCCGFVYLLGTAAQPRRIGRGIGFVLAGMFLHFTWDDSGGLGFGSDVLSFFVLVGSVVLGFTLLSIAFRRAAPREHQFVRDILAPEVASGTVTAEEVEGVLDRKARKAFRRSASSRQARRARKHLRRAVLDLTHDIAQARGADTDTVANARGEVARVRATAEPDLKV